MFDSLIKIFRSFYRDETKLLQRPVANQTWSIKSAFINLALLLSQEAEQERQQARKYQENEFSWHDSHISLSECIYHSRKSIELARLFQPMYEDGNETRSKAILIGAAGTGKSTVAQRLAYDWATATESDPLTLSERNTAYKLVLWIKLRDLVSFTSKTCDTENEGIVFVKFLFATLSLKLRTKHATIDYNQILSALFENEDTILYICDGNDEIANLPSEHLASRVYRQFLLTQPNILITSRPHHDVPFPDTVDKNAFRKIETLGFRYEDCLAYLDQHFKDNSVPGYQRLYSLLKDDLNLRGLAHIPINMEILCTLMSSTTSELPDLTGHSRTLLYREVLYFLLKRHSEKWLTTMPLSKLLDKETIFNFFAHSGLLSLIGKLALQGLAERRLVFSAEEVKRLIRDEVKGRKTTEKQLARQLFDTGFFRGWQWQSQDSEAEIDFKGSGEFLHLTLQEYIAAWWLVVSTQSKQTFGELDELSSVTQDTNTLSLRNLLVRYKYHPTYCMVWQFVAGLAAQDSRVLSDFAQLAEEPPYIIVGASEDIFILRCSEQIQEHDFALAEKWTERINFILTQVLIHKDNEEFNSQERIYLSVLAQCNWLVRKFQQLIVDALNSSDINICRHATRVLYALGSAASHPIFKQVLISKLEDPDNILRINSALALSKIDETQISRVTKCFFDLLTVRTAALPAEQAQELLLKVVEALILLGQLIANEELITQVFKLSQHSNSKISYQAAVVLGKMGHKAYDQLIPVLRAAITSGNSKHCARALHILREFSGDIITADDISLMLKKILDEDWDIRYHAAQGLCIFGPRAVAIPTLLSTLLTWLSHPQAHVRGTVAYLLGELAKHLVNKTEIKSALLLAKSDLDPWTRSNAIDALNRLGTSDFISVKQVEDVIRIFADQQRRNILPSEEEQRDLDEPDWQVIEKNIVTSSTGKIDPANPTTKVSVSAYWTLFEKNHLFHQAARVFKIQANNTQIRSEFVALITTYFCKEINAICFDNIVQYYQFLYESCKLTDDDRLSLQLPRDLYTYKLLYNTLQYWFSSDSEKIPHWLKMLLFDIFDCLEPTITLNPIYAATKELSFHLHIIANTNELIFKPLSLNLRQAKCLIEIAEGYHKNTARQSSQFISIRDIVISGNIGHSTKMFPLFPKQLPRSKPSKPDLDTINPFIQQCRLIDNTAFNNLQNYLRMVVIKHATNITTFFSYSWPHPNFPNDNFTQEFIVNMADTLSKMGITILVDRRKSEIGANSFAYMEKINTCDSIVLFGTRSLGYKHSTDLEFGHAIRNELNLIKARVSHDKETQAGNNVFPVVVTGDYRTSLPRYYEGYINTESFQDPSKSYLDLLELLFRKIVGEATYENCSQLWDDFRKDNMHLYACVTQDEIAQFNLRLTLGAHSISESLHSANNSSNDNDSENGERKIKSCVL